MSITIDAPGMDLTKTIKCGQVFRYKELGDQYFEIHAKDSVCQVQQHGEVLHLECSVPEEEPWWVRYFNVDVEPAELEKLMSVNALTCEAYAFSKGTRFLRQYPFECLANFIISQQKRIPQIQASVELLCEMCGPLLEDGSRGFPDAKDITRSIIPQLRLGFRGPYLYDAASQVASGELVLEDYMASKVSYQVAMQRLQRIHGVGTKIADCVALFALGFTNAFPVDTHIIKVLEAPEMKNFSVEACGEYAGLVQQYLYNYALYNGY